MCMFHKLHLGSSARLGKSICECEWPIETALRAVCRQPHSRRNGSDCESPNTQVDQRGDSVVPSGARVAVRRPRAFNQSEGMGEDVLPTQGAGAKSGLALTILQSTPGEDVRPGGTQRGRVSPWRRVPFQARTHPPLGLTSWPGRHVRTHVPRPGSITLTLALSIHYHDCRNLSLDHGVQQGSMSYAVMTRVHDSTISVHDWGHRGWSHRPPGRNVLWSHPACVAGLCLHGKGVFAVVALGPAWRRRSSRLPRVLCAQTLGHDRG